MKERVQKFGRFLSGMVMPNIGAFIAWGFITALFIADGWLPNERIATMVTPMLNYLLPVLIGYTGGRMIADQKGAVAGAIATLGVIVGAGIPMFIGAMIVGPLGGLCVKKFDEAMEGHIPAGFEMLVNNFSVGIIGGALSIVAMFVIGPACEILTNGLGAGVGFLVDHGLLPFTAILVEPAKVLFLNNAINHGVFTPIGLEQAQQVGKSILFMIESNPGPGLGLLLAYCVAGKGSAKSSAAGAAVIQSVGGIHELYFPFVLMNPILILGPMTGNFVAILTLSVLGGGLKAAASPGSVIAELLMTPKGAYFANICGMAVGCAVSFAVTITLMKLFVRESEGDFEAAQAQLAADKAAYKGMTEGPSAGGVYVDPNDVKKIVFACDAGMGSSAMGATMLRNKLKSAGIGDITVVHAPVSEVPKDCQIIVTHHELSARAAKDNPGVRIIPIKNFMGAPEYDALVTEMVEGRGAAGAKSAASVHADASDKVQKGEILLKRENIKLGCKPVPPEQAIRDCGRMMVEAGIVEEGYIEGMIERNKEFPVAIGNHVAIPHGTNEARKYIIKNGLVCMTYPEGIAWDEDTVKLVIGIAVKDGGDHVDVLSSVAEAADTEEATDALVKVGDVEAIYKRLNGLK
ncbi:MAG: PTS mannitol transporter subunit IICBA [Oscillibacter sp.]|nr:PTS mannitol transporter subunit IICBA [Oscillibacter sp.]